MQCKSSSSRPASTSHASKDGILVVPCTSEDSIAVFKNITQPRQRYKASVRSTSRSNPGQRKKNTWAKFLDRNRAVKDHLLNLQQLHIEDEGAVGRDPGERFAAIGSRGGDRQATLAADSHAENADVPTLDHLTLADLEGEWGALLVG